MARLQDGNLTKEVTRGRLNGRCPPGRQRRRWEDNIKNDLRLLGVADPEDWWTAALDKRRWRELVASAKDHLDLQLQE